MSLVYVGMILDLQPIPDADNIELATVLCGRGGKWRGVVRKGDFKFGGLANVYLPDSILPKADMFSFMEKYHYRVRQMRFRGVPSECLIMPYTLEGDVGLDITELAGVTKYEKPLPGPSFKCDALGKFPAFIPKTDEMNFQSVPHIVEALVGLKYYATEKADGTSCTVYFKDGHFGVCSRNLELKETEGNVYWEVAKKYGLHESLPKLGDDFALQFEIVGPGIQGNPMGLKEREARVFDAIDLYHHEYTGWEKIRQIAKTLDIPTVLCYISGYAFMQNRETMQQFAEDQTYSNGHPVEGVVYRSVEPKFVLGERVSFKVMNLKYESRRIGNGGLD